MNSTRTVHGHRSILVFLVGVVAWLLSASASAQLAAGQSKFLGNVIGQSVPQSFTQFWNQVTPENAGKWGSAEPNRDQMSWSNLDLTYNFAQQNGFPFKGHTLIWGQQAPGWMNGLSQAEQRAEIEEWFAAYAQRYPNTWAIDVVNEPLHAVPTWTGALGGNGATGWDWVITAFQLARQYMPNTLLLINEYGTENDPSARQQYLNIINLLRTRGLVDGIGLQAHHFNLDNTSAATLTQALNDYAATGLDIYISELDIIGNNTEAGQAAKYQELFPVMWNHSAVKGITLWGYIVGQTWRDGTGIVNSNGTDRQAMTWLKSFFNNPPTPNYSLSAAPGSVTVNRGASGSTTISIARTGGFTGSVAFSVSGLPSGVTASFTPTSTTGNSVTLALNASSTATLGAATLTVTGTSGALSRTTNVALTVSQTTQPDFSLAASPASVTVNRSASAASAVAITRSGGFTGSVAFTVSGLPSGVTASFNPTPTSGNSSTLSFTASSTATLGTAPVTITGTSGSLSRTATIQLTVSQGGGTGTVTVTPAVTSASGWFNEQQIRLTNTAPLTALSVTIVIQRTTGISYSGQYNTVGGQIAQSNSSTAAAITYQFNLAAGQTLSAGSNRTFAAQTGGTGTAHPTSGDTWSVTYTSGGQTTTQTGTF